jgi:hypothetical protein
MNDEIRDAATQSAQQGGDIRGRVHDLTLEALKARRFDRETIRDVVRSVTEGISRGAEGSGLGVRQTLAEGFRGMDQALTASVQAGHEALRQRWRRARLSENEPAGRRGCARSRRTLSPRSSRWRARRTSACAPSLGARRQAAPPAPRPGGAARLIRIHARGLELAGEFGARFSSRAVLAHGRRARQAGRAARPAAARMLRETSRRARCARDLGIMRSPRLHEIASVFIRHGQDFV